MAGTGRTIPEIVLIEHLSPRETAALGQVPPAVTGLTWLDRLLPQLLHPPLIHQFSGTSQ